MKRRAIVGVLFLLASSSLADESSNDESFKRFYVSFGLGYAPNYETELKRSIGARFDDGNAFQIQLGGGVRLNEKWSTELSSTRLPVVFGSQTRPGSTPDVYTDTRFKSSMVRLGVVYLVRVQKFQFLAGSGVAQVRTKTEFREFDRSLTIIRGLGVMEKSDAFDPFLTLGMRLPLWRRIGSEMRFTKTFTDENSVKETFSVTATMRF